MISFEEQRNKWLQENEESQGPVDNVQSSIHVIWIPEKEEKEVGKEKKNVLRIRPPNLPNLVKGKTLKDLITRCLQEMHFKYKDTDRLKMKVWKSYAM